jgi:hypothetical protein
VRVPLACTAAGLRVAGRPPAQPRPDQAQSAATTSCMCSCMGRMTRLRAKATQAHAGFERVRVRVCPRAGGAVELNLIAEDTNQYGQDRCVCACACACACACVCACACACHVPPAQPAHAHAAAVPVPVLAGAKGMPQGKPRAAHAVSADALPCLARQTCIYQHLSALPAPRDATLGPSSQALGAALAPPTKAHPPHPAGADTHAGLLLWPAVVFWIRHTRSHTFTYTYTRSTTHRHARSAFLALRTACCPRQARRPRPCQAAARAEWPGGPPLDSHPLRLSLLLQ